MKTSEIIFSIVAGGWISILIAIILLIFSTVSFGIIIGELIRQKSNQKAYPQLIAWLESGKIPQTNNVYGQYLKQIEAQRDKHEDSRLIRKRLASALAKSTSDGQSALSFLASIGSNSPYIGLFGTVIGVKTALERIGLGHITMISDVARPVGESLIMTAMGLFVAIPAVIGFNLLTTRRRHIISNIKSIEPFIRAQFSESPLDPKPFIEQLKTNNL